MNYVRLIILLSISLLNTNSAKAQNISYTEILTWINSVEYPGYMFSKLEDKGFSYHGQVNLGIDCKGNAYRNDSFSCFVTSRNCNDTISAYVKDKKVYRGIHINCQKSGKKIYDQLINSIIKNCKRTEVIERKMDDLIITTYVYTNNKGVYFSFHKYLASSSGMGYFIIVEKAK